MKRADDAFKLPERWPRVEVPVCRFCSGHMEDQDGDNEFKICYRCLKMYGIFVYITVT